MWVDSGPDSSEEDEERQVRGAVCPVHTVTDPRVMLPLAVKDTC